MVSSVGGASKFSPGHSSDADFEAGGAKDDEKPPVCLKFITIKISNFIQFCYSFFRKKRNSMVRNILVL